MAIVDPVPYILTPGVPQLILTPDKTAAIHIKQNSRSSSVVKLLGTDTPDPPTDFTHAIPLRDLQIKKIGSKSGYWYWAYAAEPGWVIWVSESIGYQRETSYDVFLQDQTSKLVDRFLTRTLNSVTLAQPLNINDRQIQLVAGHGFVVGEVINITEGIKNYQADVIAVNVNTITVNNPLDNTFTVSAAAERASSNMNVNATAANPIIFKVVPPLGVFWDINILAVNIIDDTAMDDGTFGGIPQLLNGVVYRTTNNNYANIFNARNNGCFARHTDRFEYSSRAPAGVFGLRAFRNFNSQQGDGVAERIGGDDMHEFQCVIADNLTALGTFLSVIRGHVVDGRPEVG